MQFPDAEVLTKDLLKDLIEPHESEVTVGVGVPANWTKASPDHLQVSLDGTPIVVRSIVAHSTVRVTAWAKSTTRAKQLANLALGLLSAHGGGSGIAVVLPLTGCFPARDTDTGAELASVTVRVTVRSISI